MNIQIFGTKKCKDTQKALRFFKERGVKPHFVDLNEKSISDGELNNISKSVALEDLIDKDGKDFQKKNLAYLSYDIKEELLKNPLLLKTPIVRFSGKATSGYKPEIWKEWVG